MRALRYIESNICNVRHSLADEMKGASTLKQSGFNPKSLLEEISDSESESNGFSKVIGDLLQKHANRVYSCKLRDSHIALWHPSCDLYHSEFCAIQLEYARALQNDIQQIVRYEKELCVWSEQLSEILDEDLRVTVLMDYAFPVFRTVSDIPNVFKDQVMRGAVRLSRASHGDYSLQNINNCRINNLPQEFETIIADGSEGQQLWELTNTELYKSNDAKYYRELHGRMSHDASRTLVSSRNSILRTTDGVSVYFTEEPYDLNEEIERIERMRINRIKPVYETFQLYSEALYHHVIKSS